MLERLEVRIDDPLGGAENMAEDFRLLSCAEGRQEPWSCLRLYRWIDPTVSLGRHQIREKAYAVDYCEARRIPWVYRPTGGRAVFHDRELTYALVSNEPAVLGRGLTDTYRTIARVLACALSSLGVQAFAARKGLEERRHPLRGAQKPCFATPSRHELLVGGRKLVGSAQRRMRRSVLQHGSIPLQIDYRHMGRVLGFEPELLQASMISLGEAVGKVIGFMRVAGAIRQAFLAEISSLPIEG